MKNIAILFIFLSIPSSLIAQVKFLPEIYRGIWVNTDLIYTQNTICRNALVIQKDSILLKNRYAVTPSKIDYIEKLWPITEIQHFDGFMVVYFDPKCKDCKEIGNFAWKLSLSSSLEIMKIEEWWIKSNPPKKVLTKIYRRPHEGEIVP